ncbi:MAG: hypothetical protein HeimC3_13300 [Candidatus Heimdallarchaeota archaeon LC_3]|nr:MAG: hypothetical protein HeimC3_13300 [Candidatus Heimdallarchaeota archaeon LC_3]
MVYLFFDQNKIRKRLGDTKMEKNKLNFKLKQNRNQKIYGNLLGIQKKLPM